MTSFIKKLQKSIDSSASTERISALEDMVSENLADVVDEKEFYKLPTSNFLNIVNSYCKASSADDKYDILCKIIHNESQENEKEAPLLLNVINLEECSLNQCVTLISSFEKCPLCTKLGKAYKEEKALVDKDWEFETKKRDDEITSLKTAINIYKEEEEKRKEARSLTEIPDNFEHSIYTAAEKGNLESIKFLVRECYVNPSRALQGGITALSLAASNDHGDCVAYLLGCYTVSYTVLNDMFECAMRSGKQSTAKAIFEKDPLTIFSPNNFVEYIKEAYTSGYMNIVKYFLEESENITKLPLSSLYPFKDACNELFGMALDKGNFDDVKYFADTLGYLNLDDAMKNSVLIRAASKGTPELIKYLIDRFGADIEFADEDGRTPLYIAIQNKKMKIGMYLINTCHAKVDVINNKNGRNLLHLYVEIGYTGKNIRFFVEKCGLGVDSVDFNLDTPLHIAARKGNLKLATILVEQEHADINKKNIEEKTPFDEANSHSSIHCHNQVKDYLAKLLGVEVPPDTLSYYPRGIYGVC